MQITTSFMACMVLSCTWGVRSRVATMYPMLEEDPIDKLLLQLIIGCMIMQLQMMGCGFSQVILVSLNVKVSKMLKDQKLTCCSMSYCQKEI